MSPRPRDSQRSKVYKAETAHSLWFDEALFDSVGDVQRWVDSICKSRWFKNRFPRYALDPKSLMKYGRSADGIKVLDGRGRRRACGLRRGFIKLPIWTRTDLHILHEIAHVVTTTKVASHGREFCANYLALVRQFMGKEEANELRECFKRHKVKYTRPARKQ